MKERIVKQIAVVNEADAERFQEQVNAELLAHAEVTGIEYHDAPGSIVAIITYIEKLQEVETVEDYFALQGKRYVCNDCSACELDPDRRAVTHYCRKHKDRVRLKDRACEWFLQGLKSGELHLVTPEERRAQYDRMDAEELKRRKQRQNLNHKKYRDTRKEEQKEEAETMKRALMAPEDPVEAGK